MNDKLNAIRQLIAKNDLQSAFALIKESYYGSKEFNDFILQESRFNEVRQFFNKGIIPFKESSLTTTQIKHSLLELVSEIEYLRLDIRAKLVGTWDRINTDGDNIMMDLNNNGTAMLKIDLKNKTLKYLVKSALGKGFLGYWKLENDTLAIELTNVESGILNGPLGKILVSIADPTNDFVVKVLSVDDFKLITSLHEWKRVK